MEIYIVTYRGKISSEAYKTYQEALDFIQGRSNYKKETDDYKIHPVRIKGA